MIRKIHLALKTANIRNAGTNSKAVLIIGQENWDLIQHTFQDAEELQEGKSHFLTLDVAERNLQLEYNYVRLGIRGADAWLPEFAFVWVEKEPQYEGDPVIQPLALKTYASETLSVTEKEGFLSIPLSRAYYGGFYNKIQFFLIIIKTGDSKYAGTQSPVWLTIRTKKQVVVNVPIHGADATRYGGTYIGNFGVEPFSYADLQSIELGIDGEDAWMPEQVMIFGYEQQYAEQKSMMPVVYIPDWKGMGLPQMSTDPKEGSTLVKLYQAYL
ncbi:MAG: hypothetical protein SFU99_16145 [Saprospiraceae bacterium]|nr:hypothetical protein [Saprospiraceae bacterium]